jgi:RNA polymerase sigma factor (sigma-70 family)
MEVHVSQATQIYNNGSTNYASGEDFCRIFSDNMGDLYLLALLLTADAAKAEQCFVAGFGESVKGNRVFREWAYSWAKRTVVQHAIRMIKPVASRLTIVEPDAVTQEIEPRLREILKLDPLERFVFVMSILEKYSYQDCSLLLGCSRQTVANAAARALEHLTNVAEIVAMHGEKLQAGYATVAQ